MCVCMCSSVRGPFGFVWLHGLGECLLPQPIIVGWFIEAETGNEKCWRVPNVAVVLESWEDELRTLGDTS